MAHVIRILLIADTHLGFDLPVRPRIERRRRGHDFLANYATALQPALDGAVDIVVHGGDVFNRSRVVPSLAYQAFEPLTRVAETGVAVFVVPGNHERGKLPHLRFAHHRGIHIFDRPRTFVADVRGVRVALAGFPSERDDVRTKFGTLLRETAWQGANADVRLLCMHQCVEGATVGPGNFTFTTGSDVIRGAEIPMGFAAVLSGHIHRHQILSHDLRRRALAAPVFYPGSIERCSFAEVDEEKGYMIVEVVCDAVAERVDWRFIPLPARPLVRHTLSFEDVADVDIDRRLRALIDQAPADAVLTIHIEGNIPETAAGLLSAARIRSLAPETMNVEVRPIREAVMGPRPRGAFSR